MSLKEYNQFISSILEDRGVDVGDKNRNIRSGILYTFLRLQQMFHYDNLPDTIPHRYLEFYLMLNGHCAAVEHEGKLYTLRGGFGGEPDAYYEPTKYIIANPYLKLNKIYTRGVDCVVIGNDSMYYGLLALVSKYIGLMAENEISMNLSVINSRIMSIIVANTDNEMLSAEEYLQKIRAGKMGAVMRDPVFEGIKTQPYATAAQANALTNMIEYEQYLKASLFNELGLNANYNMKRESINSNESQLNDDMLTPLIDDMLSARKRGIDEINAMFGTNITVDFDSAWKENEITTMMELNGLEEGEQLAGEEMEAGKDALEMSEDEKEMPEDTNQDDEETPDETPDEIKEDIEEIKEDIEEIKEDLEGGEDNENEDKETSE